MLNPIIKQRIQTTCDELNAEGKLHTRPQLARYFKTFRAKFGPEVLKRLDGTELLEKIHARDDKKDSLVYWLEFKKS